MMMNKIKEKFEIKEMLKFLVGGGSAVIVDAVLYAILKQTLNLSLAKAISYVAGAAVGFVINKLWTFESKSFQLSEIFKYVILYACSAVANTVVNKLILLVFSSTVFAFLCATGTSTVINFLGQKFVVFRKNEV
jgi:putative flippase GtrA